MSDEVDRILDLIDGGLQSSGDESGYGVQARDGCCTRCCIRPLVEGSDFCEDCRIYLLGDGPDPREQGRVFYMGDRSPDEDEGFLTLRTVHALRDAITGRFVNGGDFGPADVDPLHDPGQHLSLHGQGRAVDLSYPDNALSDMTRAWVRLHTEADEVTLAAWSATDRALADAALNGDALDVDTDITPTEVAAEMVRLQGLEHLEEVEQGLEQAYIRLHTNSITANDIAPVERTDFVRQEHEGNWVELEDAEPVTWVQTEEGGVTEVAAEMARLQMSEMTNAEPITWSSDAWRSGLIVEGVAYSTPEGLVVIYAEEMVAHLGERDDSMTHVTES